MKKIILIMFSIFLISFASAASTLSEPSVCCEKTDAGAYCINRAEENCVEGFRISPTSCESTSYCNLGTCYDSSEGICMENTPQIVCDAEGGTWSDKEMSEVPQCQLGCCVISDQAAFVPLVRCKKLSSFFGVEMDYRTDISSELLCVATAQSQDMGACVYEEEFEKTCDFATRGECNADEEVETVDSDTASATGKKFYKDYLCSAEELNTNCARQMSTECYQGKVYWKDSCGNRENVYSSNKDLSWNNGRVAEPEDVCAKTGSSTDCGNCDYLLGARCAEWENILGLGGPDYGDYYCQDNNCMDRDGNDRKNGESWCVYDAAVGEGKDPVGSRHFKEICVDGKVRVEACADFRNEVCYSGITDTDDGDFETAGCRVNRWQECVNQAEKDDCENVDQRDCIWLNSRCLPEFAPGFEFWDEGGSGDICSIASKTCTIIYKENLFGDEDCEENCECEKDDWAADQNAICTSLGDCGGYVNYLGKYTDDGYTWKKDGSKKSFSQNTVNKITISGRVISQQIMEEVA